MLLRLWFNAVWNFLLITLVSVQIALVAAPIALHDSNSLFDLHAQLINPDVVEESVGNLAGRFWNDDDRQIWRDLKTITYGATQIFQTRRSQRNAVDIAQYLIRSYGYDPEYIEFEVPKTKYWEARPPISETLRLILRALIKFLEYTLDRHPFQKFMSTTPENIRIELKSRVGPEGANTFPSHLYFDEGNLLADQAGRSTEKSVFGRNHATRPVLANPSDVVTRNVVSKEMSDLEETILETIHVPKVSPPERTRIFVERVMEKVGRHLISRKIFKGLGNVDWLTNAMEHIDSFPNSEYESGSFHAEMLDFIYQAEELIVVASQDAQYLEILAERPWSPISSLFRTENHQRAIHRHLHNLPALVTENKIIDYLSKVWNKESQAEAAAAEPLLPDPFSSLAAEEGRFLKEAIRAREYLASKENVKISLELDLISLLKYEGRQEIPWQLQEMHSWRVFCALYLQKIVSPQRPNPLVANSAISSHEAQKDLALKRVVNFIGVGAALEGASSPGRQFFFKIVDILFSSMVRENLPADKLEEIVRDFVMFYVLIRELGIVLYETIKKSRQEHGHLPKLTATDFTSYLWECFNWPSAQPVSEAMKTESFSIFPASSLKYLLGRRYFYYLGLSRAYHQKVKDNWYHDISNEVMQNGINARQAHPSPSQQVAYARNERFQENLPASEDPFLDRFHDDGPMSSSSSSPPGHPWSAERDWEQTPREIHADQTGVTSFQAPHSENLVQLEDSLRPDALQIKNSALRKEVKETGKKRKSFLVEAHHLVYPSNPSTSHFERFQRPSTDWQHGQDESRRDRPPSAESQMLGSSINLRSFAQRPKDRLPGPVEVETEQFQGWDKDWQHAQHLQEIPTAGRHAKVTNFKLLGQTIEVPMDQEKLSASKDVTP